MGTTIKITIRQENGEVVSQHEFEKGEYLIGRDPSCEILIDDEHVSRRHARLIVSADLVEIEDMNSSSGTSIDDTNVYDRVTVLPGQKVRIHDCFLDITREKLARPESHTAIKVIIRHKGGGIVSQHVLEEGEFLIGRDPSSDIFIHDEYVSRQHAKLIVSSDLVEIEDLESSSGTSIDNKGLRDCSPVRPGQEVRICDFYLDITREKLPEHFESAQPDTDRLTLARKLGRGGTFAVSLSVIGVLFWFFVFSSKLTGPAPAPSNLRSRDEIFKEKVNLPTLFLTEKTKQRVEMLGGMGGFVKKDTGEICWRAFECRNPDCPAKVADSDPYLFVLPEPGVFMRPDWTLGFDREVAMKAVQSGAVGGCPECLKIRDLKSETPAIRERYASYVQPHVLPDTARKLKKLDEEYKRRVEWENKQK